VDPFAEVDEENLTEEATLEANIARDRLARLSTLVTEIVDQMTPDIDEVSLKDGCMQLVGVVSSFSSPLRIRPRTHTHTHTHTSRCLFFF
jgi:hypothetical protein